MIQSLSEVFTAATEAVNLPFTVLVVLMVGYWLLVIVGVVDLESGDLGLGLDVDADVSTGGEGLESSPGGLLSSITQFLHLGHIPATVLASLMILCMWVFALLGNHYFNSGLSLGLALALVVPNLIVSLILTRYLVLPLKPLFRALNKDYDEPAPILGQICAITTSHADETFGQADIATKGAPITVQVRTLRGEIIQRGETAVVVGRDEEHGFYQIKKFEEPKLKELL